eukprot:EC715959.1.p1 GENE.EC715959.1~~EC715959.1.p1  ORF type:complete len:169 (+),score=24.76 EC715959.1:78-584(+)
MAEFAVPLGLINPHPVLVAPSKSTVVPLAPKSLEDYDRIDSSDVFDYVRTIRDPEHPYTLQQLGVVTADSVRVQEGDSKCGGQPVVCITFKPTVPHCSLASTIGLCMRVKLMRELVKPCKIDIVAEPGSHHTEHEINRQVYDKERVAAAMENPAVMEMVETLIRDTES